MIAAAASVSFMGKSMVTDNPSCPSAMLMGLASDDDPRVGEAVAESLNCPPWLQAQIRADPAVRDLRRVSCRTRHDRVASF